MTSWRDILRREAGEMDAAIRAALALGSDEAVRVELERLAMRPHFSHFTWLWAPAVWKRHRVMFRPLILSYFDREAIDREGRTVDPWAATHEASTALAAVLAEADAADDLDVTKRFYGWALQTKPDSERFWREDLVRRFRAAATPSARSLALAKIDAGSWLSLDPATAIALWELDRVAARKFILAHLPWRRDFGAWRPLLERTRALDADLHFDLYRRMVDETTWRADVLALPTTPDVAAELECRHPALYAFDAAPVFHALLEQHGDAAVPYVTKHVASVGPRYTWHGKAEGKGLAELLALTRDRWIDLWAALLRTSASRELFDAEIRKLVRAGDRSRLERLAGRGREFHGAGWSSGYAHVLDDETACALYAKYPALVRGPYRIHIVPTWGQALPKLTRAAIAAADEDLVDFIASRSLHEHAYRAKDESIAALVAHYDSLGDVAFVQRAARALGRMPTHTIWSYKALVGNNPLAALLFEKHAARFLGDSAAVRDLLESPAIHVQILAFRILGQDDPRAPAIAAEHVDLLQATLLRRLRPSTRKLAFAALRNALAHDEATARYLVGRMRDALGLPEKRYPAEALVGLLGHALHRWPALRGAREQPVIYGAAT